MGLVPGIRDCFGRELFFACFANKIPSQLTFANFLFRQRGGDDDEMIYSFRQGIVQKEKEGVCLDHGIFFSSPT